MHLFLYQYVNRIPVSEITQSHFWVCLKLPQKQFLVFFSWWTIFVCKSVFQKSCRATYHLPHESEK